MADAKSLFQDLRSRLEPKAYRWRKPGDATAPPVPDEPLIEPPPAAPEPIAIETVATEPAAAEPAPVAPAITEEVFDQPDDTALPTASDMQPVPEHEPDSTVELAAEPTAIAVPDEPQEAPEPAPHTTTDLAREVEAALDELEAMKVQPGGGEAPNQAFEAMTDSIQKLVAEIEARTGDREPDEVPAVAETERTPNDGETPVKGGNLLADVRAIAAGWFRNGRASDKLNRGPGDVAMPEELVAAAADRGVDVTYEQRELKSLTEKDFPCIALDKTGASHVLLGRPEKDTLLTRSGDSVSTIAVSKLQAIASGVIFFVRPKPAPAVEPSIGQGQAEPAKLTISSVFGTVSQEMFATQRPLLWQLALATVLSNLFTFALPLFSMAIYDRVVPHLAWETLWALSIGVAIILGADFALRYIRMKLLDSVGLTTSTTLQARLFSRIVHGKMRDIPSVSGGVASGMREVEALCHVVPSLIIGIAVDLPFFILAAILIYSIGGLVAIAPIIGALILAGLHVASHLGEDAARNHSRYVGTQTNALLETMGTLETVKTTGAERTLLRRWERLVDASSYASHLNRLQGNFSSQASVVVGQAVTVLAMIIGVYEISTGAMTIGGLTASVLLIGRMMAPISQLMTYLHRAQQLTSSAQMMERIFAIPQETAGDASEMREETPIAGHLQLHNVSFSYPGEQRPTLESITLDIRPGEKIGLIGRVGSGKSTLLRLMLRLHDPVSGTILIDGTDVRQVSPRTLRRTVGFMRQDSILFDDTLQANLSFGLETMTPANFERAVAITGVKDFAARNPQGYGLRVGSRGERLSGGERQSVAMARLLVEDPAILIMDEPTSAMDNALEARIVKDLRPIVADKTLIVATHRAPLLSLVDRIIWMDGGKIVADGPKAEVLQRLNQNAA